MVITILLIILIIVVIIIIIIIAATTRRNYEYIIRRTTIILTIISTRRIVVLMIRQSLLAELGRSFSCSSSSLFSLSKNSSWQESTVKVSHTLPPPAPRTKPRPRPQIRSSGWKCNESSTQHLPTAVEQSVPEEPPEAPSTSHAPQLYTLPAQNRSPLPHPPLPPSPPQKKKKTRPPCSDSGASGSSGRRSRRRRKPCFLDSRSGLGPKGGQSANLGGRPGSRILALGILHGPLSE